MREIPSAIRNILGKSTRSIGKMADEVVEVVYGIPIWHKGGKNR